VRLLADHAIARHYRMPPRREPVSRAAGCGGGPQAALVARWLLIGSSMGLMNTIIARRGRNDRLRAVARFMDTYDPATVFSSIDQHGRYAYGNQPRIAVVNLARLAETLLRCWRMARRVGRRGAGGAAGSVPL